MSDCTSGNCGTCQPAVLERLGLKTDRWDFVVALAGNPNTGKSTIFNALTGLRQHTGNWPGKTIARAEGGFSFREKQFKLVDLPGTYSLLSASPDEEVARDFILFGKPSVTVVVVDATRLERNLNLVLQVLQITDKVVVCVNLMDEAKAHGLTVDCRGLARDLGVPVVGTAARQEEGIDDLLQAVFAVASGATVCNPYQLKYEVPGLRGAIETLAGMLRRAFPAVKQESWIALRLLEGDARIVDAVKARAL
ncbi:MAG: Fe(2+) transporter FeoB [Verrucomicrobiae bacterium]|nr:Fe(2+) transporter FeoB [Verrucomicrobiae bacterium]